MSAFGKRQSVRNLDGDIAPGSGLTPVRLRCDYRENPLGIDNTKPRLSWWLDSGDSAARSQRQTADQVLVSSRREALDRDEGDLWDSAKVLSGQAVLVEYEGQRLTSRLACHWKVRVWDQNGKPSRWSAPGCWTMGLLEPEDWMAQWIAEDGQKAAEPAAPLLRKSFTVPGNPARAIVYVSSLGYHELYINGQKVGKDVLAPQVTPWNKYVFYTAHDITRLLKGGLNCVGLWMSDGFVERFYPGSRAHGIVQLEIECDRGERLTIASDGTWKTHPSHIRHIGRWEYQDYGGERLDCGGELPDWSRADFNDTGWANVRVRNAAGPDLRAQTVPPTAVIEEVPPLEIKQESERTWLVDMGRVVTGWFAFAGQSAAGRNITLDYLEWMVPDTGGTPNWNQRDVVIPDASGQVCFCNKFNYHTFRYIRIKDLASAPALGRLKALLLGTDLTPACSFSCSNELLNRIYRASLNTFLANSVGGYIADCPERERAAYGYVMPYAPFMLQHFAEGPALTEKSLRDAIDAQRDDGLAPTSSPVGPGGPAGLWPHYNIGAYYAHTPLHLYFFTGDRRIMAAARASAEKYLARIESFCDRTSGLLDMRQFEGVAYGFAFLGEWLAVAPFDPPMVPDKSRLPRTIYNNSAFILNLDRMSECLSLLGDGDGAERYRAKADQKRRLMHERYYRKEQADYGVEHVTHMALPLLAGVPPASETKAVWRSLEQHVREGCGGRPTAGDLGMMYVLWLIRAMDRPDLVYLMVNRTDTPSWGAMLKDGGATIWENWGDPHDDVNRVGPPAQNSQSRSHTGLGSIGEWFLDGLAGIQHDPAQPGFKHIIIRPFIPPDMDSLDARYDSVNGPISVRWQKKDSVLCLEVSIPPNTTATLFLQTEEPGTITESGQPIAVARGIKVEGIQDGSVALSLGSGMYSFTYAWR